MTRLYYKATLDSEDILKIRQEIQNYEKIFIDIGNSAIGKYTNNFILETVEESLNYLEIFGPEIKKWADDYLEKNRGELWLARGIEKGSYLTDYWKITETKMTALKTEWPFLFNRETPHYKDMNIDLIEAQQEILRQRERQNTSNPNYKPFHPNGCEGCSCWMLDDMEQWYEEEVAEKNASNNIFFNEKLQSDFYKEACKGLDELKPQWETWRPAAGRELKGCSGSLDVASGQTLISIILSWIKSDFNGGAFSIFSYGDPFQRVWDTVDNIDAFIKCQRRKLKTTLELL